MTEIYFRGEWVEKSLVNLWLSKPENQRILQEEEAKEKAEAEEERKQQQQRQRAETKSRDKRIQEYFNKFRQEYAGSSISDELAGMLWVRARNSYDNELRDEERRKQREEWDRQIEESEKKRQKEREQMLEVITKARRRKQLEKTILQEYDNGRILRLDDQTHDRLTECAKPGETALDVINRLLDVQKRQ